MTRLLAPSPARAFCQDLSRLPILLTRTRKCPVSHSRRLASSQTVEPKDRFAQFTKDFDIEARTVRIKDPATGRLGEVQELRRLLRSLDLQTHTVVQLAKGQDVGTAVVRVYEKMELLKQIREKEAVQRQQERASKATKPKQIELNWAIGDNDLDLKLRRLEEFLDKGKKVEILMASKKKQRRASPEEASAVLQKLRQRVQEIGAKEIKDMEGQVLKQAILTIKKDSTP